ncbi:MAG: hypothetical protein B6U94_05510 [Thermofilum sp. ex4484_79]|nr:MAG: hypothetical protein B6U94_05510 [Thermofilum sp. ex4484_79]
MRIWPHCIPCLTKVRLNEILKLPISDEKKIAAMARLMNETSKYIHSDSSTVKLATLSFRMVKEFSGVDDPYKSYKEESNRIASSLLERVREKIEIARGFEKFRKLVILAINSNMLDPGTPYNFTPRQLEQVLFDPNLKIDDTKKIYSKFFQVSSIVYLLDNCGEALFDLLLVEFLAENVSADIIVVAKGKPYQNDVTYNEALKLGFQEYAKVLSTESDAAGPIKGFISDRVLEEISNADLVISKGMANYETFLDEPFSNTVAFLLKAKCVPVATSLRVKPGDSIAYFLHKTNGN